MDKRILNCYDKDLQRFKKIRWAKRTGAPVEILQDLQKIEKNGDFLHKMSSGGWDEKFQHILSDVKPLCEAELNNNTVALCEAQLLSGEVEDMNVEERLKSAVYAQACLKATEKTGKIKNLKKKLQAVEKNVETIKKTIEIDCCLYEQLKEEVSDLTKKTALIDLKVKYMNKHIEEWNEVAETLKNVNLAYSIPKTPVVHSIPKKSKLTPEIEAMMRSWVKKYMDINKASLGPEVYDTGRDADAMLDDILNDLMLPKVQVPSKDIMTALVEIVVECRKTMIKTMEENVDDQSFGEHRQNNEKYRTAIMEFHHEADEELKHLRKSVHQCEIELVSLHTELAEEIVSYVPDDVEGEADNQEKRELLEDYLDRLTQVKRLSEMTYVKENITVLSEETAPRSTRNDTFQTYITDKMNAFNLISNFQDQLKTQGSQVRQLTETNFRSAFEACKELEFTDLKRTRFENWKSIFVDELENFLSDLVKIITRSGESDASMFSTEAQMNLTKETDVASGPHHKKSTNNILNLLSEYRKMISLSLPTVESKILSLIDNRIKEVELMMDESMKIVTEKPEELELMTETDKMQDDIIVLNDLNELPFYNWIPEV